MREAGARAAVVTAARSIFSRSLSHGSTGNISVRLDDTVLITPTGSSLGSVVEDDLSLIDLDGAHVGGAKPSKEAFLHAAMYRARPQDRAVVHTHSLYSTAVSCLDGLDPSDAIPPLTAYFAMRIGRLPLLAYHAPGDGSLRDTAEAAAREHCALLLSNHGPIVAGVTLDAAMDAIEELEATAHLFLLLRGVPTRPLTPAQAQQLAP